MAAPPTREMARSALLGVFGKHEMEAAAHRFVLAAYRARSWRTGLVERTFIDQDDVNRSAHHGFTLLRQFNWIEVEHLTWYPTTAFVSRVTAKWDRYPETCHACEIGKGHQ